MDLSIALALSRRHNTPATIITLTATRGVACDGGFSTINC